MLERTIFTNNDLINILFQSPVPMVITENNNIIHSNHATAEALGYSFEELLEMNLYDILDQSYFNSLSSESFKNGTVEINSSLTTKSGDQKNVLVKTSLKEIKQSNSINIIQLCNINEKHESLPHPQNHYTQLESLFEFNSDLIFMLDEQGYFTNINPSAEKLLKYSKSMLNNMIFTEIIHEKDFELAKEHFMKISQGEVLSLELRVLDINQEIITLEITAGPIIEEEQVKGIIGIARDVTLKKEIECQLQESEQRYRSLFDYNIDAVLTFDLEGRFTYINQATENLMGYSSSELIGRPFLPFIVQDRQDFTINEFMKVLEGEAIQYETAMYNKQEEIVELHVTVIPIIVNGEITGIHCIGKDITEKKYFEEKLNSMAFHDYLTKLPNQYAFNNYMDYYTSQNIPFTMFFLDIDRFKSINDALGHDIGDLILKTAAKRLNNYLPKHAKVFRYGGDEFIITLTHTNEHEIEDLARLLISLFEKPFHIKDMEVSTTTSVGISIFPNDGRDMDTLIRKADNAMYFSKRNGKNQFQIYQCMKNSNDDRNFKIEPLLKDAIQNNELSLVYQPQINLNTNKVHGVEALIRWESEELGNVPPGEFIPIAEESGLIIDIGSWVLETACKQLYEWKKSGLPDMQLSINVSIRQFYHTDFLHCLENTLKKYDLDPQHLELEITESIASNTNVVLDILHRIRDIGVKTSIDDFGTGYSSLNYLKEFPINYLKIDKSFVDDITNDNKDQDIVSTIISLAHNLNLLTVAEGTETEDQIEFLRQQKCDIAQGYYFSKPLDSKSCMTWILEWEK